jgi:dTDP-4-dehydrorhamnose 3,5-epimerase
LRDRSQILKVSIRKVFMKIVRSQEIPDVLLFEPDYYKDGRGYFYEIYREKQYLDMISSRFVQDNYSYSGKGVIRGLHYQICKPQGKLISVLAGEIFDVAVDIRRGSPTFGNCATALISADNRLQIYVPRGFAHGFQVIGENACVLYKCTEYFDPVCERGIRWNDPDLKISWPLINHILSEKDERLPFLSEISEESLPEYSCGEK